MFDWFGGSNVFGWLFGVFATLANVGLALFGLESLFN